MANSTDDEPLGIDLGTTNSGVARLDRGQPQMILSESGAYTVPSVVSFTKDVRLVGEDALDQAGENPKNTIYEVKRLIGKSIKDATVVQDIEKWPFTVEGSEKDKPRVRVTYCGKDQFYYPEQISAMILAKLRILASEFFRRPIKKAVITVPAAFNDAQRQATIDAGTMAGLEVLRIINEPTAAAIAYGYMNQIKQAENRKVLVFDLGGGTFDASILKMQNKEYTVLCTLGDAHLGGVDFDSRIQAHFEATLDGVDLEDNPRAKWRLRTACENAKKRLSTEARAFIHLDNLAPETDLDGKITRAKFEELCADLFDRAISITKKCLEDANLKTDDIHDVVMVGGSSRIPKIRELVSELFSHEKMRYSINPDEAVAQGAVIQASSLLKGDSLQKETYDLVVRDCLPRSLGQSMVGAKTSHILRRGQAIPVRDTKRYHTVYDQQDNVLIKVMEGESEDSNKNDTLGSYTIDVPKAPAGKEEVDITYYVNENGVLEVMARSVSTGKGAGRIINRARKQFTDDEMHQHRLTEDQMQQQSKRHAEKSQIRLQLESLAYRLFKVPALKKMCDAAIKWIESTPDASNQLVEDRIAELKHKDAARKLAQDELEKKIESLQSNPDMQATCYSIRSWVNQNKDTASEHDFKRKLAALVLTNLTCKYCAAPVVIERCKELQGWIENSDSATFDEEYRGKMGQLNEFAEKYRLETEAAKLKPKQPSRVRVRLEKRLQEATGKHKDLPAIQEKCRELQHWLDEADSSIDDDTFMDKYDDFTDFVNSNAK